MQICLTSGTQRFIRRVSVPQHSTQADFVDLTDLSKVQAAFKPNTKVNDIKLSGQSHSFDFCIRFPCNLLSTHDLDDLAGVSFQPSAEGCRYCCYSSYCKEDQP